MTSQIHDDRGPTHQRPGAAVTAIRKNDRITILDANTEYAIDIGVVHPPRQDGTVYVSGRRLNSRGKPYATSAIGLHLAGPAGDTWDWYHLRKPVRTERTGRRRMIMAEGDGSAVYRTARHFNASATITVAPDAKTQPDIFLHPRLTLTVHPDGQWTVERRDHAGVGAELVMLATGHVDGPR
ncbi:hypothetical protein JNW91_00610 [Micromonospora sp. STR1_7]|uniref:Uncharacterized protein n=1 Tax=Micromonospora parastrephiae TaxID=2806101 RepID=A0ABS1XMN9_9ACTN|nr:hypothetical protein [Micromonospora parastrephiae]MBM0230503.1 hypothetical protein [Micromonospora parastrephiae]